MSLLKQLIPMLAAATLVHAGCSDPESPDCLKSAGTDVTIQRDTGPFNGIHILEYVPATLVQDTVCYVEITGGKNLLDKMRTEVEDGILLVENKNTCNFVRDLGRKPGVIIHVVDLRQIILDKGAGDLVSSGVLTGDSIYVAGYHSNGALVLDLHYESGIFHFHTGTCDLQLRGNLNVLEMYNHGYGVMDASALITATAYLNNSSINDMRVRFTQSLFAGIYSSGNILYSGNPGNTDVQGQGTGLLIQVP